METILRILGSLAAVYTICWGVHFIGNWFDFDYPIIMEEKSKQKAKDKYGITYKRNKETSALEFLKK